MKTAKIDLSLKDRDRDFLLEYIESLEETMNDLHSRIRELEAQLKNARNDALREAATVATNIAKRADSLLKDALRRAANPILGDIRDWDNQAAGLEGMVEGAEDCAGAIFAKVKE